MEMQKTEEKESTEEREETEKEKIFSDPYDSGSFYKLICYLHSEFAPCDWCFLLRDFLELFLAPAHSSAELDPYSADADPVPYPL